MTDNDAASVEKISLSRISEPDRMIWRDSMIGTFYVKSTYYEAHRVLGRENVERV